MLDNVAKGVGVVVLGAVSVVAFAFIGSVPIYLLWNDLMPSLFGIKQVTFWQALEVSLLASSLFNSSHSSKS